MPQYSALPYLALLRYSVIYFALLRCTPTWLVLTTRRKGIALHSAIPYSTLVGSISLYTTLPYIGILKCCWRKQNPCAAKSPALPLHTSPLTSVAWLIEKNGMHSPLPLTYSRCALN